MDRVIHIRLRDRFGRPVSGSVNFYIDGQLIAAVENTEGDVTWQDPSAPPRDVRIVARFERETQEALLAPSQNVWEFRFRGGPPGTALEMLRDNLPAAVGLVLLLLAIVLAFGRESPSGLQRQIILGTFALAAGGIGSIIPGLLKVDLTLDKKLKISAAGALAMFVILFFFTPAELPT